MFERYEKLIGRMPNILDYNSVMAYCAELLQESVFLIQTIGKLEKEMLQHQHSYISRLSDEEWKKIKNSSTLIDKMAKSTYPNLENYEKAKFYYEHSKTTLFNINTLIANK